MEEDRDLRRVLDETLDAISDWPEELIRQTFGGRRIPRKVDFRLTIGNTEYTVVSHFKKDSAEPVMDKVKRLLEGEAV
jgi:hypothetical protein